MKKFDNIMHMKKLMTWALAAVAAMAFPGCMKNSNPWDGIEKVAPGMQIYNTATFQNSVSMQPADAAMRLAMLVSEALSQDPDCDLTKLGEVTVSNKNLLSQLFNAGMTSQGGTSVEVVEGVGYRIRFDENVQQTSGLYLSGSVLVTTNGTASLASGGTWDVTPENVTVKSVSPPLQQAAKIVIDGGATRIVCVGREYTVSLTGFRTRFDESTIESNWSGRFKVTAPDAAYTYETCAGELFQVEGVASGASMYTASGLSPLSMSYSLSDARFARLQIVDGTQTCRLTDPLEYDSSVFPSPEVIYRWTLNEANNTVSYRISYNGSEFQPF